MGTEQEEIEATMQTGANRLADVLLSAMGESTEAMRGGEIVVLCILQGLMEVANDDDFYPSAFEMGALLLCNAYMSKLDTLRSPWPGNDDEVSTEKEGI